MLLDETAIYPLDQACYSRPQRHAFDLHRECFVLLTYAPRFDKKDFAVTAAAPDKNDETGCASSDRDIEEAPLRPTQGESSANSKSTLCAANAARLRRKLD